tara:strand:- start:809 stop:1180 length:372 start_codon:yes stop_codon:yes gene_type:complete
LDLDSFVYVLVGSTLGLILRFFIKYNIRKWKVFFLYNSLIVNVLASLFLGIFIALNLTNKNLLLFFFVGFLGCLSTFSSFIYELFNLIQKRKYLGAFFYYVEVLALSFLFFLLGYIVTLLIKN